MDCEYKTKEMELGAVIGWKIHKREKYFRDLCYKKTVEKQKPGTRQSKGKPVDHKWTCICV